jgi:glycosyltransferase involved in cell wall biosynthesis
MDISLVIPSYKQAKSIVANLRDIILVLKTLKSTWEIIVVIDGDIDNTETVLQKAKLPNTVVVSFPKNHGKAYALREGFKRARGGYVVFLDAGGEIDPSGIPMLLEHMKWYEADIIVCS